MMDNNKRRKIGEPAAKIGLVKLYRLVIIDRSKRKLKKYGPYISQCDACSGMDSSRVRKYIHTKTKQECQEYEQCAIVVGRK